MRLSESTSSVERLGSEKNELEKLLREAVEEKTNASTELRDIKLQLAGTSSPHRPVTSNYSWQVSPPPTAP